MNEINPDDKANRSEMDTPEIDVSASNQKSTSAKKKRDFEVILKFNPANNLLVPVKWKFPYSFKKKDYLAVIFGLNTRYEFERYFCDKIEFGFDDDENRDIGVGFEPHSFVEGMILEEKYSYKENNSFVSKVNYYRIITVENDVYGEKVSKAQIKESLHLKQEQIFVEFRSIIEKFGEAFTLFTMQSILKQKEALTSKKVNLFFL